MRKTIVVFAWALLLAALSCQRSGSDGQPGIILFGLAAEGELSVRSVDASGEQQAKTLLRGNGLFDWSPVAKRLAFTHDSALYDELRTTSLGSSEQRTVSRFDGQFIQDVSWSPDGTQFAVSTALRGDTEGTRSTLWVVGAADGKKRQVYEGQRLGSISWSPDGHSMIGLVFGPQRAGRLLFIGLDKREERAPIEGAYFGTWSPDGRHLAVVMSDPDAVSATLWVRDKSGTGGKKTADNVTGFPVWSPDSKRLALLRTEGQSQSALYTVSSDGSSLRRLAVISGGACLAWSPDNGRIAHLSPSGGLGVIGADGKGILAFPQATTPNCPLEWVSTSQ